MKHYEPKKNKINLKGVKNQLLYYITKLYNMKYYKLQITIYNIYTYAKLLHIS